MTHHCLRDLGATNGAFLLSYLNISQEYLYFLACAADYNKLMQLKFSFNSNLQKEKFRSLNL